VVYPSSFEQQRAELNVGNVAKQPRPNAIQHFAHLCSLCIMLCRLEYKVLVDDDVWMQGANAQVTVSEPSSTGVYSTTVYPWFGTDGGNYEYVRSIYSPQLGNTRDLVVYLPPSYGENPYKVRLLFFLRSHTIPESFEPRPW
jgi:hypothetical protein